MDISIESVEKLMERSDVSYEEARAALEATDGDLLEAIINLEKDGRIKGRSASYSTNTNTPVYGTAKAGGARGTAPNEERGYNYNYNNSYAHTTGFGEIMKKIWAVIVKIFNRGNANHFEIYRRGNNVLSIPVTVLVLLLIFAFWFTLPALVVLLFFGCTYRFRGPDLGRDSINYAMGRASDTADDLKRTAKEAYENSTNNKGNGTGGQDTYR